MGRSLRLRGSSRQGEGTPYGLAALEGRANDVLAAPETTRTKTLFAAACRVGELVAGNELDEAFARGRLLAVARSRGIGDAERQIRRGIEKGARRPHDARLSGVRIETRTDARVLIFEWFENLDAKGAPRRICAAIGQDCWNYGNTTVNLSYREVALAAGVNLGTVSKCVKSGRLSRWVTITSGGQRLRTTGSRTTWRLVLRDVASGNKPKAIPSGDGGLLRNRTAVQHDALDPSVDAWWSWASGWAVYSALSTDEPSTVVELAERSGYVRSTVYRTLARLRDQYGLATRGEVGWCRGEVDVDPDWDFVRKSVKRVQYEAERDRHRAYLQARFGVDTGVIA